MLNLIVNEASDGKNDKEGYITLEFRQNAYGDEPLMPGQGLVSFKLDKIADRIPGKAGLNIRVKVYTTANIIKPLTLKQTRTKLFFAIPFSMSFIKAEQAVCLHSALFFPAFCPILLYPMLCLILLRIFAPDFTKQLSISMKKDCYTQYWHLCYGPS